jgi:hypothetical protein
MLHKVLLDYSCVDTTTPDPSIYDNCIDYSDLYGDEVTCTYGTFANPYLNMGVVVSGRHTIISNIFQTDSLCAGAHVCVSRRSGFGSFGNMTAMEHKQSPSLLLYYVDTNISPILLLKYAPSFKIPAIRQRIIHDLFQDFRLNGG